MQLPGTCTSAPLEYLLVKGVRYVCVQVRIDVSEIRGPEMAKAAKCTSRRPFIDSVQAAKLLRCDPRTVRKMVVEGDLAGEKCPSVNDLRIEWRIYADQPLITEAQATAAAAVSTPPESTSPPSMDPDVATPEVAELRAELAVLRAEKTKYVDTIAGLRAALDAAVQSAVLEAEAHADYAAKRVESLRQLQVAFRGSDMTLSNFVQPDFVGESAAVAPPLR